LERFYEEDYYVFKDDAGLSTRAEEDFRRFISPFNNKYNSLLEIGCAKGHLLALARDNGWTVAGIEISPFASNTAREKFKLDVYTGNVDNVSFRDRRFDLIVGFDVIEHVADPIQFLGCLKKLLNQGGTIIMDSPNPESIFSRLTKDAWAGFNAYHLQLFGSKSWQVAANRTCLVIVDINTDHYDISLISERWRLAKFFSLKGFNRLMNFIDASFPKMVLKFLFERRLGDQMIVKLQSVSRKIDL
jgi:SAM-dependent methyltransferase